MRHFRCDECRDKHMIFRKSRTVNRIVKMMADGVNQEEVRSTVIEGGWDICPVCVKKSEVEFGTKFVGGAN